MFHRRTLSTFLFVCAACPDASSTPPTTTAEPLPAAPAEPQLLSSDVARGLDFSLRVPVGFAAKEPPRGMTDGVALREIDGQTEIMVARGPATTPIADADRCRATSGMPPSAVARVEAWDGHGEGGCRYWGSVGEDHLVETRINYGPIAHAVICVGPDAARVQAICDVVLRALVIEPPTSLTLRGHVVPIPPRWTVAPAVALPPQTTNPVLGVPHGQALAMLIGPLTGEDGERPTMTIMTPSKITLGLCERNGGDCDRTPLEVLCSRRESDVASTRACETVGAALRAAAVGP